MTTAREKILETTCQLLEMQGYNATGLNQIIKDSGSPKGSLYYYFPGGKEELTEEALNLVGETIEQRITSVLNAYDDAGQAVKEFILQIAHHLHASDYKAGGPITTVALESASTSERLRTACERIYSAWEMAFASKLGAAGIDNGRAESLASLIISAIEGSIILSRTYRTTQPLKNTANELCQLIKSLI